MSTQNCRQLKEQARQQLSQASYSPRKLFTIHIAVIAGVSLLINLINYLLAQGIAGTGGLEGITTRSILETIQSLLGTANSLALPFWEIGLVFASLLLIRGQTAKPRSLLEGFRHIGPVFRLYLLEGLILAGLIIATFYAATIILAFTPLTGSFAAFMETIPQDITESELLTLMEDPAFLQELLMSMLPMLIGILVVVLVVLTLVSYRLRMTQFLLIDNPEAGARAAIKGSWRMTKGNCMALFRLDLSFWWFYVLNLLLTAVYCMDMFLPLDINADLYFWLCCVGYAVGQVALYGWANAYLQTTYAAFYQNLQDKIREEEAQRLAASTPATTPWNLPSQPEQ